MAEGLSNQGIAPCLLISTAAVEKHVTAVFRKLSITSEGAEHRRVQAVLRYLTAQTSLNPTACPPIQIALTPDRARAEQDVDPVRHRSRT